MNKGYKIAIGILSMALLASGGTSIQSRAEELPAPVEEPAATTDAQPVAGISALSIATPDNKVLTYEAGVEQAFRLVVTNTGTTKLTNINISPRLRYDEEKWPFKTDYQSYVWNIPELDPGQTADDVQFLFTERDDVKTGRFNLKFVVTAVNEAGENIDLGEQFFYVNTTAKPIETPKQEEPAAQEPATQPETAPVDDSGYSETQADAGGFSNSGASYSSGGGSSDASASVPRVIVTGFTTDPAQVQAGSDFTLTIHLKNTSTKTRVSNMLFDLAAPTEGTDAQTTAPAFLPASGSNSIYLDGINAGGTADISIKLNAKADLVNKPYGINLTMKYEDGNAAQIDGASSLSVPVKQDARFEFSDFDITPETIAVGDEGNVSCSLYNTGRIKLYNVKAIFEGKGIKKEEVFIGNVESGATASIDAMLEGTAVTTDADKVKMTLSYEDEAGTVSTKEEQLTLPVTEAAAEDVVVDPSTQTDAKGFPVFPVAVGVIAAAVIGTVVVTKRKRKRALLEEEEGLLDEVDGPSEDE